MRGKWFVCFMQLFLLALLVSCGGEGSTSQEYAKWTFSGYIVDGATNERLPGTTIEYLDENGNTTIVHADSNAAFYITSLPYGQKVFRFSGERLSGKDTVEYGERLVSASSGTESSLMEGVLANGSRLIKLYPLNASVTGQAVLKLAGSGQMVRAANITLRIQYRDTSFVNNAPQKFQVKSDSLGKFRFDNLPADTSIWLFANAIEYNGTRYNMVPQSLPRLASGVEQDIGRIVLQADTVNLETLQALSSNVLDLDGVGLVGLSPDITPYYVLNEKLKENLVDLQVLVGDSALDALPELKGDTLYVRHNTPFPANALIEVQLRGQSAGTGKMMELKLNGKRCFKIGQALMPLASNTWSSELDYRSEFAVGDTLWVRYSAKLSAVSQVQWAKVSSGKSLWGAGQSANASAWTNQDTLFVVPDQRLSAAAGDRIAFQVAVRSASGELSTWNEFYTTLASGSANVQWTNTKDAVGSMRTDLGVLDSIVVVSSRPLAKVIGVTITDSASLPFGFMLSDVVLKGTDTIVYKPRVAMAPGTLYGMDFDVQTKAGANLYNVLSTHWKTAYQVKVVSVDNRTSTGYRRLKAVGDSLVVQFSKAINTNTSSSVPFNVNMVDVNGKTVQTSVSWNSEKTIATIKNITPLPMADFGITTTTTSAGDKARAVNGVTFDFVTADGEVVYGLKPESEAIKIYTEDGLCVVNVNVLKNHSSNYEVVSSEVPITNFDISSAVRVTFNRKLDTTAMKAGSLAGFASLQTGLGATITANVTFADSGKTVVITPASNLGAAGEYWIRLYKVPALGVSDAAAIGKYGGTFSGTSTSSNYLLTSGFGTP